MNSTSAARNHRLLTRIRGGQIVRIRHLQADMFDLVQGFLAELDTNRSLDLDWHPRTQSQLAQLHTWWQKFTLLLQANYLAKRSDLTSADREALLTSARAAFCAGPAKHLAPTAFLVARVMAGLRHLEGPLARAKLLAALPNFSQYFSHQPIGTWLNLFGLTQSPTEFTQCIGLYLKSGHPRLSPLLEQLLFRSCDSGAASAQPWFRVAVLQAMLDSPTATGEEVPVRLLSNLLALAFPSEIPALLDTLAPFRLSTPKFEPAIVSGLLCNDHLPDSGDGGATMVSLLSDYHVDLALEARNQDGSTKLLQAVESEDWLHATRLLKLGASATATNHFGCNARQWMGVCQKFRSTGPSFMRASDTVAKEAFLSLLARAELAEALPPAPRAKLSLPHL